MIFPRMWISGLPGPFQSSPEKSVIDKLRKLEEYCAKTEPYTFEKNEFRQFCLKEILL